MRTIRIHVDQMLSVGAELALPQQAAAHLARVLRLRGGDGVTLFNGDGQDYLAELIAVSPREVRVRVLDARFNVSESPLRITLAQALARSEKMDWVVQKATELGVAEIVPLVTERSEVRLDDARARKRQEHWQAVAISACEQSGRARVPMIAAVQPLRAWLDSAGERTSAMRLALLPGGELAARALGDLGNHAVLAVGPEGGFGEMDDAALRDAGFRGLRLGPRVLRTETAGIAAVAALQSRYGDW
ncbi:MAG TPA: 16S rRNA (uracil(1498)-N(3))-methyltransferase [Rhodanobacteraceae bacterium]|nr:16S rRNA (uracil(1498)-N(3))-methyltransferase [Rhodanobacteraceae bacterium]